MKAKFSRKQPPVRIVTSGDKTYIFICQNESVVNETGLDKEDEQMQETYYEYDYNEIIGPTNEIPVADIQANPENYIDYRHEGPENKMDKVLIEIEKLKKQLANTNNQLINNITE